MNGLKHVRWLSMIVCLLVGCGGGDKPKPPSSGKNTAVGGDQSRQSQTADAAVMAVVEGLKKNRLEAVWEFLPAGYQRDVNDLVHEFARRMDAQLWNRSIKTLKKLAGILRSKRDFILSNSDFEDDQAKQLAIRQWDGLVTLLETVLASEAANLEQLKTVDTGAYLKTTGSRILKQLKVLNNVIPGGQADVNKALLELKATLVTATDANATVRLEVPGSEPAEYEFVKVEGKWIPRELADSWKSEIEAARQRLLKLNPQSFSEVRQQVLEILDTTDEALDKLAAAQTADEFTAIAFEAIGQIVGQFRGGTPTVPSTDAGGSVKVVVLSQLDNDAVDALTLKFTGISDDPLNGLALDSEAQDGQTAFDVLPVRDVANFAKKIDFAKVVRVDEEKRVIVIKLQPVSVPNEAKPPR